jgi:hypothetical protein
LLRLLRLLSERALRRIKIILSIIISRKFLVIMSFVTNLPLDIISQIQHYFFSLLVMDPAPFSETNMDEMETFYLQESNRSWRNFLNVSQNEHWQFVKRSTMIWSLNALASRKYLDELPFRTYISERMANPGMQLILKNPDLESPSFVSLQHELTMNAVGFLSLHCVSDALPSCASLHVLFLDNCPGLISLGEYKNLKTLKFRCCPNLLSFGKMENLTAVHSGYGVEKSLLQSISSEKLISLTLYSHIDYFLQNMNSFLNLRELVLILNVTQAGINYHLPQLPLPLLEKLITRSYLSLNVTGLYHLKSLDVGSTVTSAVKGKEEIFPRLTSLSGSGPAFSKEDIRNYPQLKSFSYQSMPRHGAVSKLSQYEDIPEFNLTCKGSTNERVTFNIGPKARSFHLDLSPVNIVVEHQNLTAFEKVSIKSPTLNNLAVFQNVQRLSLTNCLQLTDISAIGNIAYLSLEDCPRITDFSCLGVKQRFLSITDCPGLKEVDIRRFGNIYHVSIKGCPNITKIDGLTNNCFLSIYLCNDLSEVRLSGVDYVKVVIRFCMYLSKVLVTGKVYSLQLSHCHQSLDKSSLQNCEYLKI